ncbi:hypothetical protein [Streptosporangium sp. NPDC001681]|uniref:hypothetical protein n=1 Tax=Streptosporangium sp. NPDC001681 TaxID=3154395 RepID=UPI003326070E
MNDLPATEGTGLPNPHERFTALYDTYQARVYSYAASRAGHQGVPVVLSKNPTDIALTCGDAVKLLL